MGLEISESCEPHIRSIDAWSCNLAVCLVSGPGDKALKRMEVSRTKVVAKVR